MTTAEAFALPPSHGSSNEERYRALLAAVSTFLWVADAQGNFIAPQPGWEQYTGHSFREYGGGGWIADVHAEDRPRVRAAWDAAVRAKSWYEVEWRCWHAATGAWRRCITRAVPILDPSGEVREWVGAVSDVENRFDDARYRQPEWLSVALAAGGMALWEWVPQTGAVQWSRQFEQLYGVNPGASLAELDAHIHPDDIGKVAAARADGAATGSVDVTYRVLRSPDDLRWIRSVGSTMPDSEPPKLAGVSVDVTGLMQLQERYHSQASELETLLDAVPACVWIARDPQCHEIWGNRASNEFFGVTAGVNYSFTPASGVPGLPCEHLGPNGEPLAAEELPMQRVCRTGEPLWNEHIFFRTADGRSHILLSNIVPLFDAAHQVRGCVSIAMDVTEWKRTQDELLRANARLSEFNFAASHDLREPLRQVAIYSQILKKNLHGKLDAESAQCLQFCLDGATRIQELIDDLLYYVQLAGDLPPGAYHADSRLAFEKARENLGAVIAESRATLDVAELPRVAADPASLVQLFQNLLSNAIKYRGPADPWIRISTEREGNFWRFAFADNGIGIDPEYHQIIFGMFKRLHNRSKYEGTGIGLAICHRIVERHGGRIWVESQKGQGATFYFTLPAA